MQSRTIRRILRRSAATTVFGLTLIAAPSASSASLPDLVVTSGNAAQPGYSAPFVSAAVTNRGGSRAGASVLAIRLVGGSLHRTIGTLPVPGLAPGASVSVGGRFALPVGIVAGRYAIQGCANATNSVAEASTSNNCRTLGYVFQTAPPQPSYAPAYSETVYGPPSNRYMVLVPPDYVPTRPMKVLVSLHGCYGDTAGQLWSSVPTAGWGGYLVMAPIGRDYIAGTNDGCWNPPGDTSLVVNAINAMRQHFNVDPRRIVLLGYSSGGDLAYATGFQHPTLFAGLLVENTSPFRDTGDPTWMRTLAANDRTRLPIIHLAHLQDAVYPIGGVEAEIATVHQDGWPITLITRSGDHWDDDAPAGAPTSGTLYDLRTVLLPYLGANWLARGY